MESGLLGLLDEIKDSSLCVDYKAPWVLKIVGYKTNEPYSMYLTTQKQLRYRGVDIEKYVYGGFNRASVKRVAQIDGHKPYNNTFLDEFNVKCRDLVDGLGSHGLLVVMDDGELLEINRNGVKDHGLGADPRTLRKFDGVKIDGIIERCTAKYVEAYMLDLIDSWKGIPDEINPADVDDLNRLLTRNWKVLKSSPACVSLWSTFNLMTNLIRLSIVDSEMDRPRA